MAEIFVLAGMVAFFIFQIYQASKKDGNVFRRFSRGDYMRNLNKNMKKHLSRKIQ